MIKKILIFSFVFVIAFSNVFADDFDDFFDSSSETESALDEIEFPFAFDENVGTYASVSVGIPSFGTFVGGFAEGSIVGGVVDSDAYIEDVMSKNPADLRNSTLVLDWISSNLVSKKKNESEYSSGYGSALSVFDSSATADDLISAGMDSITANKLKTIYDEYVSKLADGTISDSSSSNEFLRTQVVTNKAVFDSVLKMCDIRTTVKYNELGISVEGGYSIVPFTSDFFVSMRTMGLFKASESWSADYYTNAGSDIFPYYNRFMAYCKAENLDMYMLGYNNGTKGTTSGSGTQIRSINAFNLVGSKNGDTVVGNVGNNSAFYLRGRGMVLVGSSSVPEISYSDNSNFVQNDTVGNYNEYVYGSIKVENVSSVFVFPEINVVGRFKSISDKFLFSADVSGDLIIQVPHSIANPVVPDCTIASVELSDVVSPSIPLNLADGYKVITGSVFGDYALEPIFADDYVGDIITGDVITDRPIAGDTTLPIPNDIDLSGVIGAIDDLGDRVLEKGEGGIDWEPMQISFADVFPFCIPFDIRNIFRGMVAEKTAPSFTVDFASYNPVFKESEPLVVNFGTSTWNGFISVFRNLILVGFVIFLAIKTREIIRG